MQLNTSLMYKFKSALKVQITYSQMTTSDEARQLYKQLIAVGFKRMPYKATAFRLVLSGKGYFTFSPKENGKVHVLAKRFVEEANG